MSLKKRMGKASRAVWSPNSWDEYKWAVFCRECVVPAVYHTHLRHLLPARCQTCGGMLFTPETLWEIEKKENYRDG